jgi:hypothetical protein
MDDTTPIMTTDSTGNKFWTMNGDYHRTDGPAAEWADGDNYWWLNDRIHRTDGPAIEEADGNKQWYLNGRRFYTFDEWLEENTEISDGGKVMMKLKYG